MLISRYDLRGRNFLPIFFARAIFRASIDPVDVLPLSPLSNLSAETSNVVNTPRANPRADAIEVTVTGLGYELVEVERLARGLLRVTIDRIPGQVYGMPGAPDAGEFITVEDCERVTRQLQYALEVANLAYERLEVSSPGLDRPLRTEAHFKRFAGEAVAITLKLPFQGRKHWSGVLQPEGEGWRLLLAPAAPVKGAKKKPAPATDGAETDRALDFRFDEVREARLVPVVDFKGRRKNKEADSAAAADAALTGELDR
jgi:ribosome maturation factor RimP